jgi:hypothetical protein
MTYYQTVDIYFPFSSERFTSLEKAPIMPSWVNHIKGKNITLKRYNGTLITWKDDHIVAENKDTLKFWWKKPTLEDAFNMFIIRNGMYYQFNKDGSVFTKHDNKVYYWSKQILGTEESASFVTLYDENTGKTEVYNNLYDYVYSDVNIIV